MHIYTHLNRVCNVVIGFKVVLHFVLHLVFAIRQLAQFV